MEKNTFVQTISILGFLSVIFFSSDLLLGQEKQKNEPDSRLTKRIEYLESLVKGQQKQIESLQKEILKLKFEKPIVTLPADSVSSYFSNRLPNGAKSFTFNGRTYYMVPLNGLSDSKEILLEKK